MEEYQKLAPASPKKERQRYFQEALSDFTCDVAGGGAVRHLVDLGYSTGQIMRELSCPLPRSKVEKIVYRHMTDTGMLLEELPVPEEALPVPEEALETVYRRGASLDKVCALLRDLIERNGEENSYVSCPYGTWRRDREHRLQSALACLTLREREYILGIPWPMKMVYHRLGGRMPEIAIQMAAKSDAELEFYFFRSGQKVRII